MKLDHNFWKEKNILITGHSGFKGSWLSLILSQLGSKVTGISKENTSSDLYNSISNKKIYEEEYFIDISNSESEVLKRVFKENKFDIIFHLAAQALVPKAVKEPLETFKVNVFGTYNILKYSLEYETSKSVVVSTTDKVYRDSSNFNTETSPLGGYEFYSSSKVSQEMIIESFKKLNEEFNISTVRSGNVLGPGDGGEGRIMTDLIKSLKSNENIILRQPNSIRPWQYILDSLSGYILVAEDNYKKKSSNIFNLNSSLNNEITVLEITQKLIKIWNSKIKIVTEKSKEFYESDQLRLDSSKAENLLNWESSFSIDEILENIVEWEMLKDKNLKEKYIMTQIKEYIKNL
jgi:CDP-glucose 4,6-dehydratase